MRYFTLESEVPKEEFTLSRFILQVAFVISTLVLIAVLIYRGADNFSSFTVRYSAVEICEEYLGSELHREYLGTPDVTWRKCKYIGPSPLGEKKEIRGSYSQSGTWFLHDFEVYGMNGKDYRIILGSSKEFGSRANEIRLYSMRPLR